MTYQNSFLDEVATYVVTKFPDLEDATIIFPNKRAGLFFTKILSQKIKEPRWMPKVTNLQDFIVGKAGYKLLDPLELNFRLHEIYRKYQDSEVQFDNFFFWGEMILRDFQEIDNHLVEADQLFTSVENQKELEDAFNYLDDQSIKIIQSFWSSFLPKATKTQEAFKATWRLLKPVYHENYSKLVREKVGYLGLIYREYNSKLGHTSKEQGPIVLAGFNALTKVEEAIFEKWIKYGDIHILWDADAYYMDRKEQESGLFLRSYRRKPIFKSTFRPNLPDRIKQPKSVIGKGVSLEVGQAKAMAEDLASLIKTKDFKEEKTVIILPNEYMLLPVLSSLPDGIKHVNITMGLPMSSSSVFTLIESLLSLQKKRKDSIRGVYFYYEDVQNVLSSPFLNGIEPVRITKLMDGINNKNLIYLSSSEIDLKSNLFKIIFEAADHPLAYLKSVIKYIIGFWKEDINELDKAFLLKFLDQIVQIEEFIPDTQEEVGYGFLIKLFQRMAKSLTLPFEGRPLLGLQIMGILESRNLDFDNVFILNLNEGNWPSNTALGSYIPYNIKKAFEMPVPEHKEAISAYLFYRLLQRSKMVRFYFNTVTDFNVNGEVSRYIRQLQFESSLEIDIKYVANPIKISTPRQIIIEKSDEIKQSLKKYIVNPDKWTPRLTPSALDTYLSCRLRFYFKYVMELYEPSKMQEELDPMVFGNILHDSMELLYRDFIKKQKRKVIGKGDFFYLSSGVGGAINQAFLKHYQIKNEKKFKYEGRNIIAAEILQKMVNQILKYDKSYAPFEIIGLETSTRDGYSINFPLKGLEKEVIVGLKGKIDRIDKKEGVVRIIDYKTGRDERVFDSIESLGDRQNKKRNKAVFQLFFYSMLFYQCSKESYLRIEPGLYNSRDLFGKNFGWQVGSKKEGPVTEFRIYLEDFNSVLNNILEEIFLTDQPFDQSEDDKNCNYCPYKGICNRGL